MINPEVETYSSIGLHPVLLGQFRVEEVVHVLLKCFGVLGSSAGFVLQGNKNGFRGMLVEPGVETEEDIFNGCGRAQQSLSFRSQS